MVKLYGIAWDGWKVLNIAETDTELFNQIANDWWIYDKYAIKYLDTGETIVVSKDFAKRFLQGEKVFA